MLASPEYVKEQQALHAKGNYGVTARKYGEMVSRLVDEWGVDTLLDYGCGSNLSLRETLSPQRAIRYQAYDPGVPDYAEHPEPSELVVCVDVLEHIEPDFLEDVLDDLESLAEVGLFCTVHTGPAGKVLSDGRNAHLIQRPPEWWLPKFMERFSLQTFQVVSPTEFLIIAHNAGLGIESGAQPLIAGPVIT